MKRLRLLSTLTLSLGAMASAHALTFFDVDGQEGEPDWTFLSSSGYSTWSETFDLLAAGFDPLTMSLTGATVSLAFADDGDRGDDYATIEVGGVTLWSFQEVDGSHYDAPNSYDWYRAPLDATQLADLQDGAIGYSAKAGYGDFYLKEATLVADAERKQVRVPDGGTTLALFGLGAVVLLVLRRQMRSA